MTSDISKKIADGQRDRSRRRIAGRSNEALRPKPHDMTDSKVHALIEEMNHNNLVVALTKGVITWEEYFSYWKGQHETH